MVTCEHCGESHKSELQVCPVTGRIFRPERIFPPGSLIGDKYRLESVLGSGGMGAVFMATHTLMGKPVAVKLLLPDQSKDREMVARMCREAELASRTGHRNVVSVTDMGWSDGILYLVMEYLEGKTIREHIREEKRLPLERAAWIIDNVLAGLSAVHEKGVVHRDLKPENVIVVPDEDFGEYAKILDFGISKRFDLDTRDMDLTRTGVVMGSPLYMSPEQAKGEDLDHRADIYATGAIFYSMICGRPPLLAANYNLMVAEILHGTIKPPSVRVPSLDPRIDAVVLGALQRDRNARFASARAFREALRPFLPNATRSHVISSGDADRYAGSGVSDMERTVAREVSVGEHFPPDDISPESLVPLDERAVLNEERSKGRPANLPTRPEPALDVASAAFKHPGDVSPEDALEIDVSRSWAGRSDSKAQASKTPESEGEMKVHDGRPPGVSHAGEGQGVEGYGEGAAVPPRAGTLGKRAKQGRGPSILFAGLLGVVVIGLLVAVGLALRSDSDTELEDPLGTVAVSTKQIVLYVDVSPEHAEVKWNGELITMPIEVPQSEKPIELRISASGHRSRTVKITPTHNQSISVRLKKQ